jgi:hypothetical protein
MGEPRKAKNGSIEKIRRKGVGVVDSDILIPEVLIVRGLREVVEANSSPAVLIEEIAAEKRVRWIERVIDPSYKLILVIIVEVRS